MFVHFDLTTYTDKILLDNPDKTEGEVKDIIREYLGIMPVIIPTSRNDYLGHTDGYMAFLSEKEICLASYPEIKFLKDEIKYLKLLEDIFIEFGLDIIKIYDRPVDERTRKGNDFLFSAKGCYVNFLTLNNYIILPEFNLSNKKEKDFFNHVNKEILCTYNKSIITIGCNALSSFGGVLHCITKTN